MSRFNPDHNVAPILDAAAQWIQRCLIDEHSVFTDRPLWTVNVLDEVRTAFVDNPDAGDASFFDKLEGQLSAAPPDAKCLMAELLWVLMLFQSNIGAPKKRESIERVWSWSGSGLDMSHPMLADAVLAGVGGPGTAYNTMRWRELGYLIGLALDLVGRPRDERIAIFADRDRFEQWLSAAPQEGYRQFRHLFRYLAFPDFNERITQTNHRCLILEAYTGQAPKAVRKMSDAEQNDALLALRKKLEAEYGTADLDFYAAPLVARWRKEKDLHKTVDKKHLAFDTGYAVLRERFLAQLPGFESFVTDTRYQKAERQYKDELIELFNQTVTPAIATQDWASTGAAAIALLTRSLKSDGNRPQNIVGWRYVDLVRHLDAEKRAAFGHALADLFDESKAVALRVDRFVMRLHEVVGETQPVSQAAQRSLTGFYLTLWDPHHHIFLKTREMQRALRQVDPTFQWTTRRLTGADVERVDALAGELYSRLSLDDWDPQDYLDVQSFLWVATTYDSSRVKEESEEIEPVESVSKSPRNAHKPPLNQILFGPPGTGKTFATINKALEILDPTLLASCDQARDRARLKARFDELITSKRIRFVTFHQSFSYEDFVEGLRADNGDAGQLQYRVEPGVFKAICDDARGAAQVASEVGIRDGARIWKISIEGTGVSPTRDFCFAHDQARIGWGEVGDLRDDDVTERASYQQLGSNDRNTLQAFSSEMQPGDIVLCIGSAATIQAIGVVQDDYAYELNPPNGVRKDYKNVLPVRWLAIGLTLDLLSLNGGVRFTLKTVYEISRFNWSELATVIENAGIKLKGLLSKQQRQPLDHVLIIDEINRGNVSRVFGELITLIEPTKRAGAEEHLQVTLPYSKKLFDVPKNLYLIGTMNTADRSLAGMDIALRRRFQFVEMAPKPGLLENIVVAGVNIGAMLEAMNRRIEVLLDRDHQLGHAWFMGLSSGPDVGPLESIFRYEILPLLQEYFFEDWQRIHWVLNDHCKPDGCRFVESREMDVESLFGKEADDLPVQKLWQVNDQAFANPECYRLIIDGHKV